MAVSDPGPSLADTTLVERVEAAFVRKGDCDRFSFECEVRHIWTAATPILVIPDKPAKRARSGIHLAFACGKSKWIPGSARKQRGQPRNDERWDSSATFRADDARWVGSGPSPGPAQRFPFASVPGLSRIRSKESPACVLVVLDARYSLAAAVGMHGTRPAASRHAGGGIACGAFHPYHERRVPRTARRRSCGRAGHAGATGQQQRDQKCCGGGG